MKFKKVLLLVAVAALLTGCGCSNSARRSSKSDNPQPISETPVNPSQQPDSREPEIPISNPPIEISSNIPESHDVPPASSEQYISSNGGGHQSSSHEHNFIKNPDTLEYVCSCGQKNGRDFELNITIPAFHVDDYISLRDYSYSFKNDDGALAFGLVIVKIADQLLYNEVIPESALNQPYDVWVCIGVVDQTNVKMTSGYIDNLDVYVNNVKAAKEFTSLQYGTPTVINNRFFPYKVSMGTILPSSSSAPTQIFLSQSYAELKPGERVIVTASLDVPLAEGTPEYGISLNPDKSYMNIEVEGNSIDIYAATDAVVGDEITITVSYQSLIPATITIKIIPADELARNNLVVAFFRKYIVDARIEEIKTNFGTYLTTNSIELDSITYVEFGNSGTSIEGLSNSIKSYNLNESNPHPINVILGVNDDDSSGSLSNAGYKKAGDTNYLYGTDSKRKIWVAEGYNAAEPNLGIKSFIDFIAANYSSTPQTYTVTWQNYDGTVLETDTDVAYGATPEYNGATPTRPNTTDYRYYYIGWDKTLAPVAGDVTYTAQFYETIFNMVKPTSTSWRCNGLINPFYSGEVIIPANFYDGYPVTSIYVGAFNSCSNVTKLSVPNTVTEIEITPFAGMASLQELEIPFIGRSIDATDGDATLAYLFGTGEFTGGTYTTQYYSSSGHISSYIPDALHKVIVNGGVISRGAFYDCTHITDVVLNEGVTKIKDYAFDCSSITSIVVPSTVTRIGHYAFNHCADLVSFYATEDKANGRVLELGTNILQYCTALQNVSAPIYGYFGNLFGQEEYEGLTAVTTSDNATYYIPSTLQSVTVTGGSLMKGAFEKSWLTTIGITEDVYYIAPGALAGLEYLENLTIPYVGVTPDATEINVNTQFGAIFGRENWASGKTYAAAAFTGISGSSNVTYYLPKTLKNVTVTGNYPVFRAGFDHCEYIETITFTEGLSVVPEYFFRECKAATAIDIGTNVTDINNYAFEHCEALLEAPLYEGLEHLGRYAFGYCNALTSITIPSTITEFSRSGEGGGYQFFKCASLTTVTMLCSITDTYMFKMCPVLTTVTMSPNIAVYKQNMFEQSGLTTFTVPEGVTNLDAYVFEQRESLTTVNLPVSLVKIGGSCFSGCTALTTINYAGTTAQWASVTKNTSWAKNVIATFVTCSDGIAYI